MALSSRRRLVAGALLVTIWSRYFARPNGY